MVPNISQLSHTRKVVVTALGDAIVGSHQASPQYAFKRAPHEARVDTQRVSRARGPGSDGGDPGGRPSESH